MCGGLFPRVAKAMTDAAAAGEYASVRAQSDRPEPLWALYRQHGGSFRVISAAAGLLGLTERDCCCRLRLPISGDC
ncbi:hypothetical protein ACJ3_32620 [Pantoea sp. QMID3]|nr:hypothetical protein ACJ3_32620 [Pantoea sp. QMID3]